MTTLILINFNPESVPQKPEPDWHEEVLYREVEELARCEEIDGKLIELWWTFGPYDAVVVADLPNPTAVAAFSLTVSKKFSARTTTLSALNTAEMKRVMEIVAIKDGVKPPRSGY